MRSVWSMVEEAWRWLASPAELTPPYEPLARAVIDHLETGEPREFLVVTEEWVSSDWSTHYLEVPPERVELEAETLRHVRGKIVDVGAGAGRLALALQERGLEVSAIEESATFVDLMRRRGVRDVRRLDGFQLTAGDFDTIVFSYGSIGLAGDSFNLRILLDRLKGCIAEGGQLLVDGPSPKQPAGNPPPFSAQLVQLRYGALVGEPFEWLWLSSEALAAAARVTDWRFELCYRSPETGDYSARLTLG